MSQQIRMKALGIIIVIVVIITVASMSTGYFFTYQRMLDTSASDMMVVGSIASKLASSRLDLLRSEARSVAENLEAVPAEAMPALLENAAKTYGYLSLLVFDADHRPVAAYGDLLPETLKENEDVRHAFLGETVISTTEIVAGGGVVLRVYAPVREHVLVVTLPGLILSDLVSEFRIWKSGSIFMLDKTGAMIAYTQSEMVLERHNFIQMSRQNQRYANIGVVFGHMIQGETGVGRYKFDDVERICAYTPISGTDGWSLGVASPIAESPVSELNVAILMSAAIVLLLGGIVAFFAASAIERPFQTIKEQNESLLELKKTAENASATKSNFLANTSHEMRTPLNAIIGLSELTLNFENLSEEVSANLEKIYSSGETLLGIVNNLLDISKIESGKFELICVEYDVPSIINDTAILNVIRIAEKPIRFVLSIDETLPSRLFGDELRIKEIFNNLLSNAFK
ncbi:MAG: hypothetical protein LBS89_05040, partial [Zoogloeaceae bacterium]|nr:hypothetical protein [Zoogloeaceae bacterium]